MGNSRKIHTPLFRISIFKDVNFNQNANPHTNFSDTLFSDISTEIDR